MSEEVKVTLKTARQMFKEKNYEDAIKKCKMILKVDPKNYNALVLLAAAMGEIPEHKSQVPLALQKATQIQSDNPLAWQGLVVHYEKNLDNDDCYDKLILPYCKLSEIYSEPKFTCVLNKITECFFQLKDNTMLSQCMDCLVEARSKLSEDKIKSMDKTIGWLLLDNYNNLEKHKVLLEDIFKSIIGDQNTDDCQKFYRKYLKTLYYNGETVAVVNAAIRAYERFPEDVVLLEYICRVYCEQSILYENFIEIDITLYYESLIKLKPTSEWAAIAKVIHLKQSNNLIQAQQILKNILTSKPYLIYVWVLLCEINVKLYCWEDAESAAKEALKFKDQKMRGKLLYKMQLVLVEAMSRSATKQKWETALQLCSQLHPSNRLCVIQARLGILLDDSNVHITLNDLESRSETKMEANILQALYLKKIRKFDEAVNVLDSGVKTSESWLLLGKIYWEMEEYNYSLMAFLNGIKADRFNWECLVYLGDYYRMYGNDIERSRKCYQSALQINPNSEGAGIGLSTVFRYLQNHDANIQLLQSLTVGDSGPKWAWLQLGVQYLDQGDAMQAIKSFQHVIRADPTDNHCWESLGDAYYVRGAHMSALKSYQRALELSPQSLYPMIQLGNIKLIIGQYSEAKENFEHILSIDATYVPALKGLAETCLALAKDCISKQFLSRANEYLQQAMDSLTVAAKERKSFSCIWKLLGDVCYRVIMLPEKYSFLKVTRFLIKHGETDNVLLKRQDLFSLCTKCYCCALSLTPQIALLWHDLASSYLLQLQLDVSTNHRNLASKCLAAAKHAVKLCPSVWIHWNFLGVICMSPYIKNYPLAQHAFIMAIDKEINNPIVWSNLGTLYLHIGHLYKANEAYSQGQRAEPAYVNSWIGQALIAEMIVRKEAMDLFRHAIQLGYHKEAAVGYTHWVLNVILKSDVKKDAIQTYIIENMYAVYVAADVMARYIEYHPTNSYARNAYGLLLERQKLYKSAAEQFAAALGVSTDAEKDMVCINLARVLIQLQKYNEAIKLCQAVKSPNYNSQCHLSLAFFKAARYEDSYMTYESTLHMFTNTETEKAYTLCAMAAIAYTFERVNDAKTLLLQCIQIQPPIAIGLLAAASLGILHGDINLTTLVLKELQIYRNHSDYGHHVANLSAYFHILGNNIKKAVTVLCKAIHINPGDVRYWIRLLRILLETDIQMFSKSAKKVLLLSRNTTVENVVHIACALSFNCFMQDSMPKSIRTMQKLLFTYPDKIESWATLIAAFLSRPIAEACNVKNEWLLEFISAAQQSCQTTNSMNKWLTECKSKVKQRS